MEVGFRAMQGSFFDSDKVKRQLDRKTRRALSRFGAFVWRRAKSSIKYRDKTSAPGSPPSAHRSEKFTRIKKSKGKEVSKASSPFRELRYFAWDDRTRSVVIGPVIFRKSPMVLKLHAYGGSVRTRRGLATYPKRPTEELALKAELPKFTGLFRG
jgi:hypothetical protein